MTKAAFKIDKNTNRWSKLYWKYNVYRKWAGVWIKLRSFAKFVDAEEFVHNESAHPLLPQLYDKDGYNINEDDDD